MKKDTILAVIRHLLTFGGGLLAQKGLVGNADLETGIGAVVTLVGLTWSILEKRNRTAPAAPAPAPETPTT